MEKSFWRNETTVKVKIAALSVLTIFICREAAASWNAGLPGAVFRMPAGAWASGMGGAVSADPDYMLSWYNPARLPFLRERRASFGGGYRSLGRTEAWASYDFRVPPRVGMGASFVYRGDPSISGLYDGYYSGGGVGDERELKTASWTAFSAKIGVGYLVSRRLSVGGSVSVNYQSLPSAPSPGGAVGNTSVTSIGAFDVAALYRATPNFTVSASIRNMLSRNSWNFYTYEDFSPAIDEAVPPVLVLSSSHKTTLLERELTWGADAVLFIADGEGNYLGSPEIVAAAGAAWRFGDALTLRAGIADIELSSETVESFSPRITLGFSYSLPKLRKGAAFNYAIMTDRVWAGVDQQADVTVSF